MGPAKRTLVIVAFTLVSSCSNQVIPAATPTSNITSLRLHTTTAMQPLVQEITTAYAQEFPGAIFDIATNNHTALEQRVRQDPNLYFVSSHLPPNSPLWAAPIGQDGIAVVVHPENPVTSVTIEQLRAIYEGDITNWRMLGGDNRPLTVISREDGSGTRAEFRQLVMGERFTSRLAQIAPSSEAVAESVAQNRGAIGYVSLGFRQASVKALRVERVSPSLDTLLDNTYPLRSTIFIIGQEEPQAEYRAFIAWAQGTEGQTIITRRYAPLN